jgi:hypothetical protein
LGIILISLSVIVAPFLGLLLFREGSLPLIVLAGPAAVFLLGLLFLFTNLLETSLGVRDEIEDMPKLVRDDIRALKEGRFTWTHGIVAATIVAALVLAAPLVWYKKWEAHWGTVNVLLISAVIVAITLLVGLRSPWFQKRKERTKRRTFVMPLVGFILSVGLGLFFTEPKEFGGQTRSGGYSSEPARWSASRASEYDLLGIRSGSVWDFDVGCDEEDEDDDCFVPLLFYIVVVCVVSSVFIPHFWVLAGHLLLTVMALIAVRELLVAERRSARRATK